MVNVKGLMVGNWVYDTALKRAIILNNLPYGIDLSNREGIPVTKEILEKIGFKEHKDNVLKEFSYYRYWDKEHKYKLDVCDIYTNSDRRWHVHIDNKDCCSLGSGEFTYVHELQNLTRCITGHSLPITKEVFDGLGNDAEKR